MFYSQIFLAIVQGLVQGISNVLFGMHCALKQNIWDDKYETSYETLND